MGLCATCVHLDINEEGNLICGICGDILQHENEGCEQLYEEYEEEQQND